MKNACSRVAAIGGALALVGLVPLGGAEPARSHPNFTGAWTLNQKLSDNPRDKMAEAFRNRPRGGFGGGGRGGGFGGPRGGFGGPRGGFGGGGEEGGFRGRGREGREGRGGGPGALRDLLQNAERLSIEQSDPQLTITNANGERRFLYTDGRKTKRDTEDGRSEEIKTKWKHDKVVVETSTGRGKVTETYALEDAKEAQGRQLVVTVKVEGRGPSFSFRRVYDPAGPESPESPQ